MTPQGIAFVPTIEFGDIVIALSVVVSIIGAYYATRSRLVILERLFATFEKTLENHGDTLVEHGENIAGLNALVGRRSSDRHTPPMHRSHS